MRQGRGVRVRGGTGCAQLTHVVRHLRADTEGGEGDDLEELQQHSQTNQLSNLARTCNTLSGMNNTAASTHPPLQSAGTADAGTSCTAPTFHTTLHYKLRRTPKPPPSSNTRAFHPATHPHPSQHPAATPDMRKERPPFSLWRGCLGGSSRILEKKRRIKKHDGWFGRFRPPLSTPDREL